MYLGFPAWTRCKRFWYHSEKKISTGEIYSESLKVWSIFSEWNHFYTNKIIESLTFRVLKKKQASSLLNFLKSTKNSSNKYYLVDFIFCLELWPTLFAFLRVNEVPEDDLEFLAKQVQL